MAKNRPTFSEVRTELDRIQTDIHNEIPLESPEWINDKEEVYIKKMFYQMTPETPIIWRGREIDFSCKKRETKKLLVGFRPILMLWYEEEEETNKQKKERKAENVLTELLHRHEK